MSIHLRLEADDVFGGHLSYEPATSDRLTIFLFEALTADLTCRTESIDMKAIYTYAGPLEAQTAWKIADSFLPTCKTFKMTRRGIDYLSEEELSLTKTFSKKLADFEVKVEMDEKWPLGGELYGPIQIFTYELTGNSISILKKFGHPFVFQQPYFFEDLLFLDGDGNWAFGTVSHEQMICLNTNAEQLKRIQLAVPDLIWTPQSSEL